MIYNNCYKNFKNQKLTFVNFPNSSQLACFKSPNPQNIFKPACQLIILQQVVHLT